MSPNSDPQGFVREFVLLDLNGLRINLMRAIQLDHSNCNNLVKCHVC